MADTTTSNAPAAGGANVWTALSAGLQTAGTAFTTYEAAQTAQAAAKKLTSSSLTYVILGLGGLGIVALLVLKK